MTSQHCAFALESLHLGTHHILCHHLALQQAVTAFVAFAGNGAGESEGMGRGDARQAVQ